MRVLEDIFLVLVAGGPPPGCGDGSCEPPPAPIPDQKGVIMCGEAVCGTYEIDLE